MKLKAQIRVVLFSKAVRESAEFKRTVEKQVRACKRKLAEMQKQGVPLLFFKKPQKAVRRLPIVKGWNYPTERALCEMIGGKDTEECLKIMVKRGIVLKAREPILA